MYQRQRIDRGRQVPTNNNPFWSREADSRARNFPAFGKEDEGRYPSAQRRMEGPYNHREMDDGSQNGYHGEPKRLKTTWGGDQEKALKHSSQPVIVRKVEHHNPLINRPNGKLVRVRSLRLKTEVPIIRQEPEVPVRKKQELENNKTLNIYRSFSPEDRLGKEEIALDEKKWLYRNEHGKLCGPYPLRQLMEGLDARFLPEDLLIYEAHRGELCQPMKLKLLAAEAQGWKMDMASSRRHYDHSPARSMPPVHRQDPCHSGSRSHMLPPVHRQDPCHLGSRSQTSFMLPTNPQGWHSCDSSLTDVREPSLNKHSTVACASPWNSQEHQCSDYSPGSDPLLWASEQTFGRVTENADIPPGFGNSVNHFSERESHTYSPFLSTSAERTDTLCHPSSPGFLDEDLSEPPGFGAQTKGQLSRHPGVPMASTSEGAQRSYSSFGNMDTNLYNQNGSREQGSSSYHSSLSMQGTENLSRPDALPCAPSGAQVLNYEGQACPPPPPPPPPPSPPPVVCIGLPVSIPGAELHPRSGVTAPWHQQMNALSSPKDRFGFTLGCEVDPLPMIQHEVLSAVSASYVKSVLCATIGEHLECWLGASKVVGKALVSEQGSSSTPCLLSREGNGNVDQVKASPSQANLVCGHVESHAPGSGAALASQGIEKSGSSAESGNASIINSMSEQPEYHHPPVINSVSEQHEEHHSLSKNLNANNMSNVGLRMSSEVDNAMSDAVKCVPCLGNAEDLVDIGKSDSCVRRLGEGSSPPSHAVHDPGQAQQHQIDGQIVMGALVENEFHSSVTPTNQELPCSVPRKEKDNVKYMEQLLVMASKLKRREKKKNLAVKSKKKKLGIGEVPKALERKQGVDLAHVNYDAYARTCSDGWSHYNQAGHAERYDVMDGSIGPDGLGDSLDIWCDKQAAQAAGADVQTLALDSKATEKKLQLARSSVHNWGVFAVEPIEAGDFVIEYVGELVRPRVSKIRKCQYEKMGLGGSYLSQIDSEVVVDATKHGGLARFINHSCDPNCVTKIFKEDGSKKVHLYSKRDIRAGEELTYDYNVFNREQSLDCACGSERCRGSLNSHSFEEGQPEAVEPHDITCS